MAVKKALWRSRSRNPKAEIEQAGKAGKAESEKGIGP
jgi:hypothetical protein